MRAGQLLLLSRLLLLCWPDAAEARQRGKPSIRGSGVINDPTPQGKASECRFGGKSYELEEKWHPDLGAPFGVMYCVHCECVPIHKKRRIVGRVRCKNIKAECPKPTCPDPVLLLGRCCKICPGQDDNPDLAILTSVDLDREEQEKNSRHYATLLTGPGVAGGATGRLYFRKKTLKWSFLSSQSLSEPLQVAFFDTQDNILEEFSPVVTEIYNRTGKLCGSWPRLPKKYRRILKAEEMKVTVTYDEGVLYGNIAKYYGLSSEMFSGLLEGPAGRGTAIISVNIATGSVGSLHANLLFQGIVKEGEINVNFVVQLVMEAFGGRERRIIEETAILEAASQGINSIEIKTVLEALELEGFGQGRMTLSLWPRDNPNGRTLTGHLIPRISCDIMDCIMTASDDDSDGVDDSDTTAVATTADASTAERALSYMYFDREGYLKFFVRTDNIDEVTSFTMDNAKRSRRLFMSLPLELEPLSDGFSTGKVLLDASQVEEMLKDNLYLSLVGTRAGTTDEIRLRGRIVSHLAGPAELNSDAGLMVGSSQMGGVVWTTVDTNCRLHYALRLEGGDTDNVESLLELEDYPPDKFSSLPLFPSNKRKLQECNGRKCAGHADDLHKLTVARLDSGDAAIVVRLQDRSQLKANLSHVITPSVCLPSYARNSLEVIPGYLNDLGEDVPADVKQKCFYEGAFYDEGQQWEASHTDCQMCSCQRGKVVCDAQLCPETDCADPVMLQGGCCPTCSTPNLTGRGCTLGDDKTFHPEGSKWHPYIPPFGFSRCTLCTCEEGSLTISCRKEECPRLDCPVSKAIRPGPLSCCRTCPLLSAADQDQNQAGDADLQQVDPNSQGDQGKARTGADILAAGGCKWRGEYRENGDSWHPVVQPFGVMNCVTCVCKDGDRACRKRRCPQLSCRLKVTDPDQCCPRCAANATEKAAARRQLVESQRKLRKQTLRSRNARRRHNPTVG